jgi:hypothetical protein
MSELGLDAASGQEESDCRKGDCTGAAHSYSNHLDPESVFELEDVTAHD